MEDCFLPSFQDEWPISSSRDHPEGKVVNVKQHRTMEERLSAAREFCSTFGLSGDPNVRVLVDSMEDSFNGRFAAWPFRYYVMEEEDSTSRVILRLIGMPDVRNNGDTFSSEPLERFLAFYDFRYGQQQQAIVNSAVLTRHARMLHYSSGRRGYDAQETD